jgi:hypothetical protein
MRERAACRGERNSSHAKCYARVYAVNGTGRSARTERGRRQNRVSGGDRINRKDATADTSPRTLYMCSAISPGFYPSQATCPSLDETFSS